MKVEVTSDVFVNVLDCSSGKGELQNASRSGRSKVKILRVSVTRDGAIFAFALFTFCV